MLGLGPATRIYVAAGATDMRKGFEGLYGLVRDRLLCEPRSGHLFRLCNAHRWRRRCPPRIIEKCLASDELVIDTVVRKYCDHTPLYRQSAILERDTGLELSRATLDGWVLKVGELLIPLAGAMRRELLNSPYIQADETPVDVQTEEGRGKHHQAYLWQYVRPGGTVVFDFRLGRGREGPKQFLGQFEGILQTDGYAAYDQDR